MMDSRWQRLRFWLACKLWRWAVDLNHGRGPWMMAPVRPGRLCPDGYKFSKTIREDGDAEWHWSSPDGLRGAGSRECSDAIKGAWVDWARHGGTQ